LGLGKSKWPTTPYQHGGWKKVRTAKKEGPSQWDALRGELNQWVVYWRTQWGFLQGMYFKQKKGFDVIRQKNCFNKVTRALEVGVEQEEGFSRGPDINLFKRTNYKTRTTSARENTVLGYARIEGKGASNGRESWTERVLGRKGKVLYALSRGG